MYIPRPRSYQQPYILLKCAFDLCFSFLVVMLVLSWLVPVLGLLLKLESREPIFFKQLRRNEMKLICAELA
ncbi:sugar transferase [Hymenobacter sp. BT188]|nr:sugar transferase [Hymenobacter sp. BT188]